MKKPVPLQVCSTFTRLLKVLAPPAPALPTSTARRLMASNSNADMAMAKNISSISFSSYGDPCHDLYFHVTSPDWCSTDWLFDVTPPEPTYEETKQKLQKKQASINYLKQLLPVAWSHNPLTTLKLIFNLNSASVQTGKHYPEAFYTAAYWLHHNHPKTLLCNVPSFASSGSLARLWDLVEILYGLLLQRGQDTAAQRLHRDRGYKLLHDRVMDLLTEQLKSDIDKLKQHRLRMELELKPPSEDDDKEDCTTLFVTEAAACCTPNNSEDDHTRRAVLLFESLGCRLFPPESDQSEEWELLRKEFLEPLDEHRRRMYFFRKPCVVKKYLEEVKAGGSSIIKPNALLPNDIIRYVKDKDVGEAAELQWKAMVEDMYLKQKQGKEGSGKFKNCLAVCNITDFMGVPIIELAASLGILLSELTEELAWKQKVISLGPLPDELPLLHSLRGGDLKSKYEFMTRTCISKHNQGVDFQKVCDLILEVAVNENLKAEQMIKKVFVFTDHVRFGGCSTSWKTLYEETRSKFKEQGYGDNAMPHILLWQIYDLGGWMCRIEEPHPGVTLLAGISDTLIKSFLDNGGEIGRRHLMEAAIADKEYQNLCVVN
ncbi:uncharacterized protein Pyn_03912 [Prunus yedoensis var. nudiflora]|uniref:Uncharacterized protein n=1 Tax=Prunus yedoensis var. nudiflora TaxID=2094558 RepID=A0A314UHF8_PRUYE|nr:uncharacterized protein Pyn_03912 [Prunus yedoensis var. nudiflora]